MDVEIVEEFFRDDYNFNVISSVNSACPPLSLRTITWFVNKGMAVSLPDLQEGYQLQLKEHTRRQFDPFRRSDRVTISNGCERVDTTYGQMNFFRWMIESGAWEWLLKHRAAVHADASRMSHRRKFHEREVFRCIQGPHVVVFD